MNKFDKVMSELPRLAAKVMPGFSFTFSMRHFAKDNKFQLSMSRDYGHNDGPIMFLQGEGLTTEEAAAVLTAKFVTWCMEQATKQQDELMKTTARLQASILSIGDAALEAASLVANETVDN